MTDETQPAAGTPAPITIDDLIKVVSATSGIQNDRLLEALEAMARNVPKRKVTIGEYDPRAPWQQGKPKAQKLTLTRPCSQNGDSLNAAQLSNTEIALLNQIDRSGRYLDRLVEVIVRDEGVDEMVEIRYAARTKDQMNAVASLVRNFGDMLRQIVDAQKAEEAEMLASGAVVKRRAFGDTAAFREATARRKAREAADAIDPA